MRGGTFFPLVAAVIATGLLLSLVFGEFDMLVPMILAVGVAGLAGNSGR